MTRIIEAQIHILEVAAGAVAAINKGIDKVQAKVVVAFNQRLDRLADEYLGQAAAVTAAPYKQSGLLREQWDALTAEFTEDSERLRAAYAAASTALIDKQADCTSPEALDKARAKADAIYKARAALLARKK